MEKIKSFGGCEKKAKASSEFKRGRRKKKILQLVLIISFFQMFSVKLCDRVCIELAQVKILPLHK